MTATDTAAVKPAILMSPAAPNISMSPLELDLSAGRAASEDRFGPA
jgi:hypothetical protein